MRHRVAGRRLGRTKEHRLAMRRNMVASLIQHETISTTIEKAKEVRPFAEKMITLAKRGTLAARRQAIAQLGNRDIIEEENGQNVKKGTIIGKLFSEIGPRYLDRPGGYTRIIRLSLRRLGDNGKLVLLQLVGTQESIEEAGGSSGKKRSRKKIKDASEVKVLEDSKEPDAISESNDVQDTEKVEGTVEQQNPEEKQEQNQ